jgi:HK97 family phage prohead protease
MNEVLRKLFTEEEMKKILEALKGEQAQKFLANIKGVSEEDKDKYGRFKILITTEDLDRQGEVIRADAWKFENYLMNPVVLWAHDYYGLPMGVTEKIQKEGNGYFAEGFFAPGEANPLAQQVRRLYDVGILRTASVGFIPWKRDEKNDTIITEAELLEWSFVPVPANPRAVSLLGADGVREFVTKGIMVEEKAETTNKPEPETEGEYIIIRVQDPDYFDGESFRTISISESKGIKATVGCKKGEFSGGKCGVGVEVQRYLFDKEKWDVDKARAWVDEHKSVDFAKIGATCTTDGGEEGEYEMGEDGEMVCVPKGKSAKVDDSEKVGRVLSEKNRTLIKEAKDQLGELVGALGKIVGVFDELLTATEPAGGGGEKGKADIKNEPALLAKEMGEWFKDDQKFLKTLSTVLNDKLRENKEKYLKVGK